MKSTRRAKPSPPDFLSEGRKAFLAGRPHLAAEAFAKAVKAEPRNPVALFNLASAKERIGDIDEAAQLLTQALRQRPAWFEPAQRLAMLNLRYVLQSPGALDPHGMLAAFAFDRIDRQAVAAAAIAHLRAASPLGEFIALADAGGAEDAARDLILRRTDKILAHPLLLAALTSGANRDPGLERLLTALRRVLLLEVPADRFEDKALTGFVLALIGQCLDNEHVFVAGDNERDALAALGIDWSALRGGASTEARKLLLGLLYRPRHELIGDALTSSDCRSLRPRGLGELLARYLDEAARQTELAESIPVLGAIDDPTSRKVARQYEAHPYPRWTSLQMPVEGSARKILALYAPPQTLSRLEGPYKVLIAGAGTGKHALGVAVRYGPQADVLAVDLSRASLAYAKAKAESFGVGNIRFAQADLLAIPPEAGPFDIIEAVGVLHHMDEPFKGWQALLGLLKPGGLMLTGLYSAISRRNITELRTEADYPGPACGDDAARAYRAGLMDRPGAAGGLTASHDFYTLSNFRDLALHEHERPIFLSEIEAFLDANGLIFRGFNLPGPIMAAFHKQFPGEKHPGSLAAWAAFEEQHPRLFDAMYQLWCEKR
ncbi:MULTISPECIES: methyltransferase domain-containing protein [Rhodomicrobium]|uniref:class I SAM-dependent methyltransferase n=1 Tax=Rhodomicrobium TaxID=1068 RepID=UPI000B4AB615|nr:MULTISPECIES: methyltransferase domain-containing protein [Rhodomicrobium]